MTIEELRKTLIEVTKNLENYTDRELVEIQALGDKLKEMAMYETFLREGVKGDEPEKAVVPQYIDTWIQGAEYNGFDLYEAMTDETPDKVSTWIVCNPETFAKAWIYGYEVEKEKLYTVKFSNEDFGKIYIGIFKKFNKLGISSLPLNDDDIKSWFTEDELKRFKFWDNPAFEIVEVEE